MKKILISISIFLFVVSNVTAQSDKTEKAQAIIKKSVEKLGGEKYMNVNSQIGRGRFSLIRDGAVISFQSFIDVIVFPDKERTEFRGGGGRLVQTNYVNEGWIYDDANEIIKIQSEDQISNFKRGLRSSLDNLLRGGWRKENAVVIFAGRRQAGIGRSNDVVKLTYKDGFEAEFEFADDGTPVKSLYKRKNADSEDVKEEDRYAQFIDVQGVKSPFIVDHFTNGVQTSRINYESIEHNKKIPDSIFEKPANPKSLKKDLKL